MMKHNPVYAIDMNNPVDKDVQRLVDSGVMELAFDADTGELCVGLTCEGRDLASQLNEPLTADDEKMIEDFLQKVKKDLDNLV